LDWLPASELIPGGFITASATTTAWLHHEQSLGTALRNRDLIRAARQPRKALRTKTRSKADDRARVLSDEVDCLTARVLMARLARKTVRFVDECDAEIVVASPTGPAPGGRPIPRRARERYNLASVDGSNSEK
jgi:hypothetical protein